MTQHITELTDKLVKIVEDQTIQNVLDGLNELLDRDILVIKKGEGKLFLDEASDKILFKNEIKLELNAQDYINRVELENDKLVGENKRLKDIIKTMTDIAKGQQENS